MRTISAQGKGSTVGDCLSRWRKYGRGSRDPSPTLPVNGEGELPHVDGKQQNVHGEYCHITIDGKEELHPVDGGMRGGSPGRSTRPYVGNGVLSHRRFSWNTHALITRLALKNAAIQAPKHPVTVVSLSDFVGGAREDVREVGQWYWDRLGSENGTPAPGGKISPPTSEAEFVQLIQLNPRADFCNVRLLQPHEVPLDAQHDPSREGPPGGLYVETASGTQLPAHDVLLTFSDEPDWGMDQDLFALPGQRYGRAPFGLRTGSSSQGPFHMGFFHENRLLYLILPALRRSFVEIRCKLFFALAATAFRAGVDYWGWRFAAWAMHYLQDVTQPYHARAFPPSLRSVARRLLNSYTSNGLGRLILDMLKRHHLIFEAFIHFLLNECVKKGTFSELSAALAGSDAGADSSHGRRTRGSTTFKIPPTPRLSVKSYEGLREQSLAQIIRLCSRKPAHLAPHVDRTLLELLGNLSSSDAQNLSSAKDIGGIETKFHEVIDTYPETFWRFVSLVCQCFAVTGEVTRNAATWATRLRDGDEWLL